jgi:hypothetical protein
VFRRINIKPHRKVPFGGNRCYLPGVVFFGLFMSRAGFCAAVLPLWEFCWELSLAGLRGFFTFEGIVHLPSENSLCGRSRIYTGTSSARQADFLPAELPEHINPFLSSGSIGAVRLCWGLYMRISGAQCAQSLVAPRCAFQNSILSKTQASPPVQRVLGTARTPTPGSPQL